ncbi:MAG: SWIM zinc finger domain-containing protein [Desulfurivibrionaceae bacterium]
MCSLKTSLIDLTWDDLLQWAGGTILRRGRNYTGNVYEMAETMSGGLFGMVSGSDEYATQVEIEEDGGLDWLCTCPYEWGPCKHAVALILAGLEHIKTGKELPLQDEEDDLFLALQEARENDDYDDGGVGEEAEEGNIDLTDILRKKNKDELMALIVEYASRYPEIRLEILDLNHLEHGEGAKVASSLLKEIEEVTSEPAWYDPWNDEGDLPDYTRLRKQFISLVEAGYADQVVDLGRVLWKRGKEAVEQSDDEGHTAWHISECLDTVFKAVTLSSLSQSEQLFYIVDILIEDEFELSRSGEWYINNEIYTEEDWDQTAEALQRRLSDMPAPRKDVFAEKYKRVRVMDWLTVALEKSGRQDEIVPLFEKEVPVTQCYERLVVRLLQNGDYNRARTWCIRGIKKTAKEFPGIADNLQKSLRQLAELEGNHDLAAAYRAHEFFERPCRAFYSKLQQAAEKTGCWPMVRSAVLGFLEDGVRPDLHSRRSGKQEWPLPCLEFTPGQERRPFRKYPDYNTLIDIAILENRIDDVVELHRSQPESARWGYEKDNEVASAVMGTYPDISLEIWKGMVEQHISRVKPKAYEEAATYLRKMRTVYNRTERLPEWRKYIEGLRAEHKRKSRLLEVLDVLEDRRIVE